MPNVWVRDQETWKPVRRVFVRDGNTWKPSGVVSVRDQNQGGWSPPSVWAPLAPQNLAVSDASQTTQTPLTWTASAGGSVDHYEIRQTQYATDKVTPGAVTTVATGTSSPSGVVTTGVTEKTYYTYEVRAVGTAIDPVTSQKVLSAWSAPFRWYVGNTQKTRSDPIYGWAGATQTSGFVPSWAGSAWSNLGAAAGYPPSRAFTGDGWNSPPWGWLLDGGYNKPCTAENGTLAAGRWDIRGFKTGAPPGLFIRPNGRVRIQNIAIGHYCITGYRNIFPGVNMYAVGRQQYFFDRMRSDGVSLHRFVDNLNVDGAPPNTNWQWSYGGSPWVYGQLADVNGDAGEYIAIWVCEWTPVFFSDPGAGALPPSLPNVRYIQFIYDQWQITSWQTTITENAANGVVWS